MSKITQENHKKSVHPRKTKQTQPIDYDRRLEQMDRMTKDLTNPILGGKELQGGITFTRKEVATYMFQVEVYEGIEKAFTLSLGYGNFYQTYSLYEPDGRQNAVSDEGWIVYSDGKALHRNFELEETFNKVFDVMKKSHNKLPENQKSNIAFTQ